MRLTLISFSPLQLAQVLARHLAISGKSFLGLVLAPWALGANAFIKMFLHGCVRIIVYKKTNLQFFITERKVTIQGKNL